MSKGIFKYPGSKNKAAKEIISYFPEHDLYVEVFGGSAAVLRHKPVSNREIYNDIRGDIVNLFKVIAFEFEEFQKRVRWLINSRQLFYEFKQYVKCHQPIEDPVKHAVMTYYTLRFGYAGRRSGWSLNIRQNAVPRVDVKYLEQLHERIKNVQFTNMDWEELIMRVDSEKTLFYLDPPYPGKGDLYGCPGWNHEYFENKLEQINGTWILSYPYPLEGWFSIPIKMQYSLKRRQSITEYLISNKPFKKQDQLKRWLT